MRIINPQQVSTMKNRAYIFDPFFTDKEAGTGLGLAVTYSIIQKNKGQIEVKSELGNGAEFGIRIPNNST